MTNSMNCGTYMISPSLYGTFNLTTPFPDFDTSSLSKQQSFSKEILKKAEFFLHQTVGDDYFLKLERGQNITVKAKNDMTYFVDRKGCIGKCKTSRIFRSIPDARGILIAPTLPMDDAIASFYIWVKNNPNDLESKWGCGNIMIHDQVQTSL